MRGLGVEGVPPSSWISMRVIRAEAFQKGVSHTTRVWSNTCRCVCVCVCVRERVSE